MKIEDTPEERIPARRKRRQSVRTKTSRAYAVAVRVQGKGPRDAMILARALRLLKAEAAIKELVDAAPPITPHQADRLCDLIRSGVWIAVEEPARPEPVQLDPSATAPGV